MEAVPEQVALMRYDSLNAGLEFVRPRLVTSRTSFDVQVIHFQMNQALSRPIDPSVIRMD